MIRRKFNRDDYEKVKYLEPHFIRAIHSRFTSGLEDEDVELVGQIYYETTKRTFNKSCGACVLQIFITVGRMYITVKEELEKEEAEKATEAQSATEVDQKTNASDDSKKPTKRKYTRKKKEDGIQK